MTDIDTTIPVNDLKSIASIVMHAAEADTLEQVLQRISHASRELIGTKYAALGVPDGSGGLRYFKVSGVEAEDIAKIEHPPTGLGLLGVIMNEQETLVLEDMRTDSRAVGFPKGHPVMKSLLGTPIQAAGELFGMLYLSDRVDGQPFNERDRWLLETMARYAALAIAGTNLRENQQSITRLQERERIGMVLHDGVIQSLYAIGMQLDLVRNGVMEHEAIGTAISSLNDVIEDIRKYIMRLKVQDSRDYTIRQHIEDIIARLYMPKTMTITINTPDTPPPFPPHEFESLCMVIQEAVSNVIRHAQASYLTIRCQEVDGRFLMFVRDDGVGFDASVLDDEMGLGLQNMQARVEQLNGTLKIESAPDEGTALIVNVPLSE